MRSNEDESFINFKAALKSTISENWTYNLHQITDGFTNISENKETKIVNSSAQYHGMAAKKPG